MLTTMLVNTHIHGRPRVGEVDSGDAGSVHVVGDVTWVLLVDALGHGPAAAEAAGLAVDELGLIPAELSVEAALLRLHERLRGSRGAAATLLRFAAGNLSFGGVGNVGLRTLAGPSVPFIPTSGIIGSGRLDPRGGELELAGDGRLLMYTDGIVRLPPARELTSYSGAELCRTLVSEHSVERDDATAVHVHYQVA